MTNARIAELAPHDRHLLRAADAQWRSADELAERLDLPHPRAAAGLARLRSAGLMLAMDGEDDGAPQLYRRA